jgi:hypothetical protein
MSQRTKIEFKVGNSIIFKTPRNITLENIEHMKKALALNCKCNVDDIETIYKTPTVDTSEFDISKNGIQHWQTTFLKSFDGIKLKIDIESDSFLDAMNNNTLLDYLEFN